MSVFPKTVASRANVRNRIRLKAWLSEWSLERSIRKAVFAGRSKGSERPVAALTGSKGTCHFVPVEGHVIILPAASATFSEGRPLYVIVLKQVSDVFLVAPFSRFATPATEREWKTGLRAKPLRVLCLWNGRTLSARALSGGWLATRLSQAKHDQALKAYEQVRDPGGHGDDGFAKACGPPLRHPLDPRHEYLAEEAALMDEHLQAMESRKQVPESELLYEQIPKSGVKVAEEHVDYGRRPGRAARRTRKRD